MTKVIIEDGSPQAKKFVAYSLKTAVVNLTRLSCFRTSQQLFALFACLNICFAWQVNAQTEFAPVGAEWHYTFTVGGESSTNHFNRVICEKDTIIEGNNCRVLRQYYDNSDIANEKYVIMQEQGKVYYYYQEQFNLLFDFNAEIGDTIEFTFKYQKYDLNNNWPLFKDTILSARYEIETITTNAQNLKTFKSNILDEDKYIVENEHVLPLFYYYTEKIGHETVFIPMVDNVAHTADSHFALRCYSDADLSFVSYWWSFTSLPCDYSIVTGINTPKIEDIRIYPNPVKDYFFIECNNLIQIKLYDMLGREVLNQHINEKSLINISHLINGLYIIKLLSKGEIIGNSKIVKQ